MLYVAAAQIPRSPDGSRRPVRAGKQSGRVSKQNGAAVDVTVDAADRPTITFSKGKLSPPAICIEAGASIEFKNDSPDDIEVRLETNNGERTIPVLPFVATELAAIPKTGRPLHLRIEGPPGPQCLILAIDYPGRMVLVDADGFFRIPRLPVGEWRLRLLRDQSGLFAMPVSVTRVGKDVEQSDGPIFVTIHPGQNDLGEIGLSEKDLKQRGWSGSFRLPWPFGS